MWAEGTGFHARALSYVSGVELRGGSFLENETQN